MKLARTLWLAGYNELRLLSRTFTMTCRNGKRLSIVVTHFFGSHTLPGHDFSTSSPLADHGSPSIPLHRRKLNAFCATPKFEWKEQDKVYCVSSTQVPLSVALP